MQVSKEFSKLIDWSREINESSRSLIKCGTLVGGLSEQKQKRVLDLKRPPVLVATPGRLWDLVSEVMINNCENPRRMIESWRNIVVWLMPTCTCMGALKQFPFNFAHQSENQSQLKLFCRLF
jgi:hypothetical protein